MTGTPAPPGTVAGGTAHDAVLVPGLRRGPRADDLLAALGALPRRLRVVLQAAYLDGRPTDELAEQLRLTAGELGELRADALRALARAVPRAAPAPPRPAHAFSSLR